MRRGASQRPLFQSDTWQEAPVPGRCRNGRGCAALEAEQRDLRLSPTPTSGVISLSLAASHGTCEKLRNGEPGPDSGRTPEVPVLFRLGRKPVRRPSSASPAGSVFEVPIWGLLWGGSGSGCTPLLPLPSILGAGSRPAGGQMGMSQGMLEFKKAHEFGGYYR